MIPLSYYFYTRTTMSDICTSHPISFLARKCNYFFMHVRKTNISSYMFEDMYNHTMECNCAEEERGGEMCAARHISKFLVQLITFMSMLLLFKMDRLQKKNYTSIGQDLTMEE